MNRTILSDKYKDGTDIQSPISDFSGLPIVNCNRKSISSNVIDKTQDVEMKREAITLNIAILDFILSRRGMNCSQRTISWEAEFVQVAPPK